MAILGTAEPVVKPDTDNELNTEIDLKFSTIYIYDDRVSRNLVDVSILKSCEEAGFLKLFTARLLYHMECSVRTQSRTGCCRLINWSCMVMSESKLLSETIWRRIVAAQSSLLQISLQGSYYQHMACRKPFTQLFLKFPELYAWYLEEFRSSRILYKNSPLLSVMVDFLRSKPDQKEKCLALYVTLVLKQENSPTKALIDAFRQLYMMLSKEDLERVILPSMLKKLKRNAEQILQAFGVLLGSCNLDLSDFCDVILSLILSDICNGESGGRIAALSIVKSLSEKSLNPEVIKLMVSKVTSVIKNGGLIKSGGHSFSYQMTGLLNALKELSSCPEQDNLSEISLHVSEVLVTFYKNTGNEIVKIACLTALYSWVARSPNAIDPEEFIAFLISGLKEKQSIRRGHLRCLLLICSNADAVLRMSCVRKPLIQLVKASSTKAEQQLDGIYALMILVKIAATDEKTAESMNDGKIAALVMKNEHSVAMVSNLSIEDGKSYLDLLTSLLVDHPARDTKAFDCKLLMQVVLAFLWHPRYAIRKAAYGCAKKILKSFVGHAFS